MSLEGTPFYKMCGSGNDFVFFDGRDVDAAVVTAPDAVRALCARRTGVGADGVVVLGPGASAGTIRIIYFNSDGSRASLCGNATLCSVGLATLLRLADATGFTIETDAGEMRARIGRDGSPEIRFLPPTDLQPTAPIELAAGERRAGYAVAGVPHLVVEVDSVHDVDVQSRGRALRFDPRLPDGANVNFVAPLADGSWRMRTYERGVEGETLACGTGAVATASMLAAWGATSAPATTLLTSSLRTVKVRIGEAGQGPWLAGEGRLVYRGVVGTLD